MMTHTHHQSDLAHDLQKNHDTSPNPVLPDDPERGIVAIKTITMLQREEMLMDCNINRYNQWIQEGRCSLYHIGPPAPMGSIVQIFRDHTIGFHRARFYAPPSRQDRELLSAWLQSHGITFSTSLLVSMCQRLRCYHIATIEYQIVSCDNKETIDHVLTKDLYGQHLPSPILTIDDLWQITWEELGAFPHGWWCIDTYKCLMTQLRQN